MMLPCFAFLHRSAGAEIPVPNGEQGFAGLFHFRIETVIHQVVTIVWQLFGKPVLDALEAYFVYIFYHDIGPADQQLLFIFFTGQAKNKSEISFFSSLHTRYCIFHYHCAIVGYAQTVGCRGKDIRFWFSL